METGDARKSQQKREDPRAAELQSAWIIGLKRLNAQMHPRLQKKQRYVTEKEKGTAREREREREREKHQLWKGESRVDP